MPIDVIWRSLAWPGLEHAIWTEADGMRADGESVHVLPEGSVRIDYAVDADSNGRTRRATVTAETAYGVGEAMLERTGNGWRDSHGQRPDLDGCIDVDISTSPLTNVLPIRRLGLTPGEHADLLVVYIHVPDLTVTPARQRYTALWADGDRSGYRYESGDFRADLTVDDHGLVIDYPALWVRRDIRSNPSPHGSLT